MNGAKWLARTASPGQFKDELAVSGRDYVNQEFSLYTSRKFGKCDQEPTSAADVPAHLQVTVLERSANLCLIKLPGQTFDNGWTITVRADQLEERSARQYA